MIEKILTWLNEQIGNKAKYYGFNTEWCALFVTTTLSTFGYNLSGTAVYSCTAQMNYFIHKGIWNDGTPKDNNPCVIYYDWDSSGDCDHVGIMVNYADKVFTVVEGNTIGDKWNNTSVNKINRSHFSRYIRGYVYLSDIFNINDASQPVYYGIGHTTADNTGKCQLIQHMLNVTNNAGLTEDGILGDKSDTAIKDFQRKYNLEIDGIVGDETIFKLTQLYFNIPLENFKI